MSANVIRTGGMRVFISREFRKNLVSLSRLFAASTNRRFKFEKSDQLLICTYNEALPVVAMSVGKPDRSNQRLRAQPKSQRRLLKSQAITVTHSISRSSPTDVFQNSNKYPRRAWVLVSLASASVPEPSLCLRQERYCLSHWRIAHRRLR